MKGELPMSSESESRGETSKNKQATTSLVLGIASLVLAFFNFAPGLCSALGCVGAAAAIFAFVSGIQGIRAAGELEGQQRTLAIVGMITAGLGLLIFVIVMGSAVLRGAALSGDLR
jgi:hypothetical protein